MLIVGGAGILACTTASCRNLLIILLQCRGQECPQLLQFALPIMHNSAAFADAFCVFIDVFWADIIYVFCNRCNCKLLIISHLDKESVFQFQLFQLLFSTFQSSFFIYITT